MSAQFAHLPWPPRRRTVTTDFTHLFVEVHLLGGCLFLFPDSQGEVRSTQTTIDTPLPSRLALNQSNPRSQSDRNLQPHKEGGRTRDLSPTYGSSNLALDDDGRRIEEGASHRRPDEEGGRASHNQLLHGKTRKVRLSRPLVALRTCMLFEK